MIRKISGMFFGCWIVFWGLLAISAANEPTGPQSSCESSPVTAESQLAAATTSLANVPLPFVYTKWRHFTKEDGLPDDHIFSVKVDGPRVWIGTEDGLACFDKRTGQIRTWKEKDGLPWRVVTAIDVDPKTGDVWLGLFGGGLARFSGGRFDHYHQLNSGLVSDVVYGVAVENDHVWAATTAGASRLNLRTGQWTIFTEKNAPMEEIWNYGVHYRDGKVHLAVWGSGVLEFDVATERWKVYLDPDREMEIDLYRDDGIIHVITTGVNYIDGIMWVSSYFGLSRYDGRHWRGFYAHETGMPSDFTNNLRARSGQECYFAHDKGLGVVAHFDSDTYIAYTRDGQTLRGKAAVFRSGQKLIELDLERTIPHNFCICIDVDETDVWVGTSKGLGWGIGEGYYAGVRPNPAWLAEYQRQRQSPSNQEATVLAGSGE
jgi:ligand-binding sensor domain-containing protein